MAKPNHGFEFVSWQENLKGNSTRLIKVAISASFFDPALNILHLMPDKPESTLNITRFGSFTANFKATSPSNSSQNMGYIICLVATAFVGSWLIPTSIGWLSARKQGSRLDFIIHKKVKDLDDKGELDKNDFKDLNNLRNNIAVEYSRGLLNKEQYEILGNEISINYKEFFTKEIDSLRNLSEMTIDKTSIWDK